MNARDIIKLAAKLYIDDYLKKKTTILANAEICENCLTEILDKKITAIKPKKIE